jgi:branched-chain amino acid transport system ATP-binding protein
VLTLKEVSAGYDGLAILQAISLQALAGEITALIGANGAGKTTTLRTISGFLRPGTGTIQLGTQSLIGKQPHDIVRAGVVQVPEGRSLFGKLTVRENLLMGGYTLPAGERHHELERIYALFPLLQQRQQQIAATMSGGQQQTLAIGRALMTRPKVLMLDEPSVGLDPKTTEIVFSAIHRICEAGIAVLMVEQNAIQTLRIARHAYVFESGRIVLEGTGTELLKDPRIRTAYLGI